MEFNILNIILAMVVGFGIGLGFDNLRYSLKNPYKIEYDPTVDRYIILYKNSHCCSFNDLNEAELKLEQLRGREKVLKQKKEG